MENQTRNGRAAGRPEPPQKPKKSRRVHRMNRSAFRIKLLTMLGVAAAIILGFVIFFKIQTVSVVFGVNGQELSEQELADVILDAANRYYSTEEIIAASGVEIGDNLLTVNKAAVAASIKTALPYVSDVQIKRGFPSSLTILVTEFEITYGICDENGSWWLINREGRVLDPADEQEAKQHLIVEGMRIAAPQVGQIIEPAGVDGADLTELSAKKNAVIQLLQTLEDSSEIAKHIVTVDVSASYDLILWYGTQYEIRLGTAEELPYKFAYLQGVLEQFREQNQTYLSGVIDITFSEGRNARFQPFE